MNLALADVLSNLHAFLAIATNHCGDDLYRFETSVAPKSGSFYMRQVRKISPSSTSWAFPTRHHISSDLPTSRALAHLCRSRRRSTSAPVAT